MQLQASRAPSIEKLFGCCGVAKGSPELPQRASNTLADSHVLLLTLLVIALAPALRLLACSLAPTPSTWRMLLLRLQLKLRRGRGPDARKE